MKNWFLALSISCFTVGYSQDWREGIAFLPASITPEYCVQLDATQAVGEWYQIDISALTFENQAAAEKAFWSRSNNLVAFQVKLDENKAYAKIYLDRTQVPHDIIWWNEYLASICPTE